MKRIVFRSLAGQPIVINKDTQFEVGDTTLEPALGGPRTRVLRAGDVIEEAAKGAANTAFDPNKRDQFAHFVSILCAFHDAGLGTSDTSEEVAQPANGHKVGPTARALLASEAEMATELPVSYRLFDWASLRAKVEHLEEVTTIRDQVAVRLENLTILQAQERQEIMADLTHFWKTSQSAIEQHRGLKRTLEPLADLMTGSAQQGVETKKEIKRAVTKALQGAGGGASGGAGIGGGIDKGATKALGKGTGGSGEAKDGEKPGATGA